MVIAIMSVAIDAWAAEADTYAGHYTVALKKGYLRAPDKNKDRDSLDILDEGGQGAFFRIHLDWANGHSCDISGMATRTENGALLYTEPSLHDTTCTLRIEPNPESLRLLDPAGACQYIACGRRGMLDGVRFLRRNRAPVDAKALRGSVEYVEAQRKASAPP